MITIQSILMVQLVGLAQEVILLLISILNDNQYQIKIFIM